MVLFNNSEDELSEIPKNPIDDEMVTEIGKLIETYIPPFMDRYSEKLKEIIRDETGTKSRIELNQETIKELGIETIEEPLTKFIMHSVGPKIETVLLSEESEKEQMRALAEKTISTFVEGAIGKINSQIEHLIALELGEEQVVEQEETIGEDEFISEVIDEYAKIVDDSPEELEDEIVEYPEVVMGVVDLPQEEPVEPKIIDFDMVKEQLIEHILKKHVHRIEEKFADEHEQEQAKELFKKRIESAVDNLISKKTKKNTTPTPSIEDNPI